MESLHKTISNPQKEQWQTEQQQIQLEDIFINLT
jgi:hypothetical protein